jgi:tetratricopeptide (TPR) repeat protein
VGGPYPTPPPPPPPSWGCVVAAPAADGGPGLASGEELVASGPASPALDGRIEALESEIAAGRAEPGRGTELAALYLERARRTGDLAGYEQARVAIDEVLAASPDDPAALTVLASIRYGDHEFADAAELAGEVLDRSPGERQALAVLGDARLELGDLDGAGEAYERLLDAAGPEAEVLVREARLAWLRGDVETAIDDAERALTMSFLRGADGPATAYYQAQLATYEIETGDLDAAVDLAELAVASDGGSPAAHGVLGRALAAAGRNDDAVAAYRAAVAFVPSPKLLAALGDLHAAAGRTGEAEEQYDAVLLIAELASSGGALVYDRDLARFLADHDRNVDLAVQLAEAELAVRSDAYAHDTLAWALYKSGDIDGAKAAIEEALATGLADVQVWYHAGMIDAAAGNEAEAMVWLDQALAVNPNFDPLHAPLAAEQLATLREAR